MSATIIKDPGCSDGIVFSVGTTANAVRAIPKIGSALAGPAPHERYVQPCFLNRALGAKVGAGRFFGFEKGYRIPEIFQYAFRTKQVPPDERASSFIEALAGRSTLPKPVKVGPGRFEAVIRSAGGEFLTGSATFTSGPPAVRTGLSCRSGGRLRPFTRLTYRGTLEPGSAPLLAAFDTLPLAAARGHPGDVHRARLRPPLDRLAPDYRIPGDVPPLGCPLSDRFGRNRVWGGNEPAVV